jgi:superfamily II DNA or RNA helicase/HKD family nuclease
MSVKLVPGLYEQLVTVPLAQQLQGTPSELVQREELDGEDADVLLARHVHTQVRHALRLVKGSAEGGTGLARQVALVNGLIAQLGRDAGLETTEPVADAHEVLLALLERPSHPGPPHVPARPEVPLSASALLVNGSTQPRIGTELRRELESADAVDLLCAFVKWQGFRVLEAELRALRERGCRLRVLTTTYMGATDRRALDALAEMGAEVRVSYETRTTRLHAKAWLFHRNTGFSTAYIGSSNLSRSALLDGLEWNVRVAAAEQPHVVDTFRATFEAYWEDTSFEPYDPARDAARFDSAVAAERGEGSGVTLVGLEVRPFDYQRAMLERLEAERTLHGRWKNLVVAATGTGKTVLAALDYARLRKQERVDSVLFVAHRDTILRQSLHTFRSVLRDGAFGELYVGGERPEAWRHVFASVQSLAQVDLSKLAPEHFDMVVVDEFHHAMADTYVRLLEHLSPRVLVGLTATPERMDGQDVKQWFDGRIAVELRLWEALDRGLLAPFQYFGVHDDVDVSSVPWKRGGYELSELSNLYTGNDARAQKVLEEVHRRVGDVGRMRALGFCVSIEHAEYMARKFSEHGIPAASVSSRTTQEARAEALRALRDRRVKALFAVDLFNEGLDVPEVDTVLFLRPTESATVFLQQLGRGLRHSDGKACLTVLDFIGKQYSRFRFDTRLRALTGTSRRELERQVVQGFPYLPAGCHLSLDRVATGLVLENVRQALNIGWRGLVAELRGLGDVGLQRFLEETGVEPEDLYRGDKRGWAEMRREAGLGVEPAGPADAKLAGAIGRMLHLDDPEQLEAYRALLEQPEPPRTEGVSPRRLRLLWMLHFSLWGANESPERLGEGLRRLWAEPARRHELLEVLALLTERLERVTPAWEPSGRVPLRVHARYSRDEALAAFGVDKPASVRQGVKWVEAEQADLLFVTLRKTERHYSPTTRYQDYAISSRLFHWESQNLTSESSETGQRYIGHVARGSSVHLFVRETKEGLLGASPYVYAGPASYVKHEGSRPMAIIWKLEHELPVELLERARLVAG